MNEKKAKENKRKLNKTQSVLEHLEKYGSITSWEAIKLYNATRISSIIFNLRRYGYNIKTESIPFVDSFGNESIYGRYILER